MLSLLFLCFVCMVPIRHVLAMFYQVIVVLIIVVHRLCNNSRCKYTQLSFIIVAAALARILYNYGLVIVFNEYKTTLTEILSANKILFCMFFLIFNLITSGHTLIKHEYLPIITLSLLTHKNTIYNHWNRFTLICCVQHDVSFVHLISLKLSIKTICFKIR